MDRVFFIIGAISALSAVVVGAFGAHALKNGLSADMLSILEIGARYQMYHALALIGAAWASSQWPKKVIIAGGWLFVIGSLLFSGSLYLLALTGTKWLGMITPLGGAAFLGGWLCLIWGAIRS